MEHVNDQNGTALEHTDDEETLFGSASDGAQLPEAPSEEEIEKFRKRGALLVAHRKEIASLEKKIQAVEFGSVKGSALSLETRTLIAEFCFMVRANPLYHVDLFGGKPYLNEKYWSDRINRDPYFIRYEQRDISPYVDAELLRQAEILRAQIAELKSLGNVEAAGRLLAQAIEMEQEAREVALARTKWGPRPTATSVIETTIYRFMSATPMHLIQSGALTDFERYVQPVSECNWAGGTGIVKRKRRDGGTFETEGDPIGDANPATTARTRSLRRCAAKAFSTWGAEYEARIRKIEEIAEAEWEDVTPGREQSGRLAIASGNGEPTVGRAALPQPLPVRDLSAIADNMKQREPAPAAAATQAEPRRAVETQPTQSSAPAQDEHSEGDKPSKDELRHLRARLFPSLAENGVQEEGRKQWARDNELPDSTAEWTRQDFERAFDILEAPTRRQLVDAIGGLGFESIDEFCIAKALLRVVQGA